MAAAAIRRREEKWRHGGVIGRGVTRQQRAAAWRGGGGNSAQRLFMASAAARRVKAYGVSIAARQRACMLALRCALRGGLDRIAPAAKWRGIACSSTRMAHLARTRIALQRALSLRARLRV